MENSRVFYCPFSISPHILVSKGVDVMRHRCVSRGQGGDLVAMAAALSVAMAQGKTADELELLAALFEIIGDNLALLALKIPSGETFCSCGKENT